MTYQVETLQGLKWIVVSIHDTVDEAVDALDAEVRLGSSAQMKAVRRSEAVIDKTPTIEWVHDTLTEMGVEFTYEIIN